MGVGESVHRILVVDDEAAIREILTQYLRDEGMSVTEAADGGTAVDLALSNHPDLIIMDLNLPVISGIEAFKRIRTASDVPIIMVTTRGGELDRVVGLELGADDYIAKPFSPREVVARVKTVLRRANGAQRSWSRRQDVQRVGDIEIDRLGHEVRVAGKAVSLTPMEYKILDVMAANVGQTFTRDQLLDKIAGDDIFDRTLDRHIANLRQKVEVAPGKPRYVLTVFGVGYKLVDGSS